jgi:hypothetical protein
MCGAITPRPNTLSWRGAQLKKIPGTISLFYLLFCRMNLFECGEGGGGLDAIQICIRV